MYFSYPNCENLATGLTFAAKIGRYCSFLLFFVATRAITDWTSEKLFVVNAVCSRELQV